MRIQFRRLFRLARLGLHLLLGLFQAGVMFGFYGLSTRDRVISAWARKLLDILGIRLVVAGIPPDFSHGALLVANHVSWLDVFVIHTARRVHFVSKREIRSWPVIGWLAWRAGTLFIERAKKSDTVRINAQMHALLKDGAWVAVFPEGTSTDGSRLLRFLPSLLQPAVDESLPIVPVALQYLTPEGKYTDVPAYAGNISFGTSLWRIAGEREIVARMTFGAPIHGDNRRMLAEAAYHEIAGILGFEATSAATSSAGNPPGTPADPPASAP